MAPVCSQKTTLDGIDRAKVFFSYSHRDEELRNELEVHLAMLKRQGLIETWHDRRITAGSDFSGEISEHLDQADIVLLLVSPNFLDSNYCYEIEMQRALERHYKGETRVIPIILRFCDWHSAPFGGLLALPPDGKPVLQFSDRDEAFLKVVQGIRKALDESMAGKGDILPNQFQSRAVVRSQTVDARSSNLRIKKEFSDRDRDKFLDESFEFIARFFENSLDELRKRNSAVETNFKRLNGRTFIVAAYISGRKVASCSIWMAGGRGFGDIAFAYGEPHGGINESLSVKSDGYSIFLEAMGMQSLGTMRDKLLTQEGASEHLWGLFITRLQQ